MWQLAGEFSLRGLFLQPRRTLRAHVTLEFGDGSRLSILHVLNVLPEEVIYQRLVRDGVKVHRFVQEKTGVGLLAVGHFLDELGEVGWFGKVFD